MDCCMKNIITNVSNGAKYTSQNRKSIAKSISDENCSLFLCSVHLILHPWSVGGSRWLELSANRPPITNSEGRQKWILLIYPNKYLVYKLWCNQLCASLSRISTSLIHTMRLKSSLCISVCKGVQRSPKKHKMEYKNHTRLLSLSPVESTDYDTQILYNLLESRLLTILPWGLDILFTCEEQRKRITTLMRSMTKFEGLVSSFTPSKVPLSSLFNDPMVRLRSGYERENVLGTLLA